MARTLPTIGAERLAELEAAWRLDPQGKDRVKLQVMRLVAMHEHTAKRIADIAGVCRASVFNYIDVFMAGGVEALLKRNYKPGRRPPIPAGVSTRLAEAIKTTPMRTAGHVMDWLKEHEKLEVKPHAVYRWLGKAGWVLKVPRKAHQKKDEAAAAGRIRLWVADEHRHGLLPVIRGVRVAAPYATKYEWLYAYEAPEIDGKNECECLLSPEATKAMGGTFLRHIEETHPDSLHIVIWDGAGFHAVTGDAGEKPARVGLITLPPYSPELNPVEALGDITKDGLCIRLFGTIGKLEEKLTELLRPYLTMPGKVRGLIPEWMLDQANATAPS